jgi:hypothetical protein
LVSVSCTFDFHELTSVLQTNLKEKTDFECGEGSVDHRKVASQTTRPDLVNNCSLSFQKKATQKWAGCDFTQDEKLRNGNMF